jgi:hypothetical protein
MPCRSCLSSFGIDGFKDGGFKDGGFKDGGFKDGTFKDGGFKDGGFKDGGFKDSGLKDRFAIAWFTPILFLLIDLVTLGADLDSTSRTILVVQVGSRPYCSQRFDPLDIPRCFVERLVNVLNPAARKRSQQSRVWSLAVESLRLD